MADTQNFLVVGGRTGIGQALVQELSHQGKQVISTSRNAHPHQLPYSIESTLDLEQLPPVLHGVAYCPGTINLKPFHRLTLQDFRTDFEVNVCGAIRVLQQVYPLLKNSNHAAVVLFSTVAVQQGMPFHASVATAKGALEGLTRSLAAEWAPKIRVNAIAPSLTDTPLAEKLLATEEKRKASAARHPLQQIGSPNDIARLAAFLLTDSSRWITGQVLHADGGLSGVRV
ncbi:MAG: SDR family oxidoreductase [Cyclobacteriaceae bacterium]|nr:SDR family oxidoreductase [Cyclobacteriaceae bacterium]